MSEFRKVVDLFNHAKGHLKFPKIVLNCQNTPIVLSLAGQKSSAPGSINIAGEGSFGNRAWYGRVSPSGQWEPSRSTTPSMLAALETLLTDFGNDPAGIAKKYGSLTGNCCFCGLKLKDPVSTAAGFGPVCAKNYGLSQKLAAAELERQLELTAA